MKTLCSVLFQLGFSVAWLNSDPKQLKKGTGLFNLTIPRRLEEGTQGLDLEAEIEAVAIEKPPNWLVPHGLFGLFSCTIQDHLPSDGTTSRGLAPSHQSAIMKMPLQAYLQTI